MLDRPLAQPVDSPAPMGAEIGWGALEGSLAVALAFVVYVIGSVLVGALWPVAVGPTKDEGLDMGIVAYQFFTAGALLSLVLVIHRPRATPQTLGFRYPGVGVLAAAAASVVLVFIGVALIQYAFDTWLPGYHLHGNAKQLLQGTSGHLVPLEKIALFVLVAIEAPITEETLFRAIFFQGLHHTFVRRIPHALSLTVAALISGLIFGLLHFEPNTLPILAFLGVALAFIFYRGRSIYASMLVHAIINGLAVVSLLSQS